MCCLIRPCRKPTQMRFELVIRKVIIPCHPIPMLFIVVILFVPCRPNIVVGEKPNQEVHILAAIGNNLFPLVLEISFVWKDNTVALQVIKQQEAQIDFPDTLPAGWISLVAPVRFANTINNGLKRQLMVSIVRDCALQTIKGRNVAHTTRISSVVT
jgi:hypothetical protein